MTTRQELADYVRSVLDVDDTDLPDAVLNVWFQDGYNRIIAMEERWPFFEVSTTLTAVEDTREYAISSLTDGPFRTVSAVIDTGNISSGWQLQLVNHDAAQSRYVGVLDTPQQPLFYSKRGGSIHLWPKPDAAYAYPVLGFRSPTNWIADGPSAEPDCDDRLHLPLADWALARYFRREEDGEMAALYEQSFKDGVALAHDAIMRVDQEYPLILNRGFMNPSFTAWMQSLGRNLGS